MHTTGLVLVLVSGLLLSCHQQSEPGAGKAREGGVSAATNTVKTGITTIVNANADPRRTGKKARTLSAEKAAGSRTQQSTLDIQGYRTGVTEQDVQQELRRRNISEYETGFSDVYAYDPSPDTEVRLTFSCSARGNVLSKIELTMMLPEAEAGQAISTLQKKLIAKYGTPMRSNAQNDGLDLCWGLCGQPANGRAVEARTTGLKGDTRSLLLSLNDERLVRACSDMRHARINQWLYGWIAAVQRFKLGMTVDDASALYLKRYGDKLALDKGRDPGLGALRYYGTNDYDFFGGLDFDSQAFEGEGPGAIVLKFTGDQAGKDSLNRRLFYTSFSTTKFSDQHVFADVRQKLDMFIAAYGPPTAVVTHPDGTTARWENKAQLRSVSIFDSGLMTFEQSDLSLKDAYRDAAFREIEEYHKAGFEKMIFGSFLSCGRSSCSTFPVRHFLLPNHRHENPGTVRPLRGKSMRKSGWLWTIACFIPCSP